MTSQHARVVQRSSCGPKPPKHLVPQVPSSCLKSQLVYRPGGCPAILAPGSSPGGGSYILGNAGRPREVSFSRSHHPFITPFSATLFPTYCRLPTTEPITIVLCRPCPAPLHRANDCSVFAQASGAIKYRQIHCGRININYAGWPHSPSLFGTHMHHAHTPPPHGTSPTEPLPSHLSPLPPTHPPSLPPPLPTSHLASLPYPSLPPSHTSPPSLPPSLPSPLPHCSLLLLLAGFCSLQQGHGDAGGVLFIQPISTQGDSSEGTACASPALTQCALHHTTRHAWDAPTFVSLPTPQPRVQ